MGKLIEANGTVYIRRWFKWYAIYGGYRALPINYDPPKEESNTDVK